MEHLTDLHAGTVFAKRYEIIAPVGKGGMGMVYLACDSRKRDFLVALKVLDPALLDSAVSLARFRSEIIASYRVDHPNVVRAYEYFDEPDFQAYAMEYVDGGPLRALMQHGPLDMQFAVAILLQAAAGLEAVHKEQIIHRDLKPENIMVSKKGEVKISDFGVARVQGAQNVTQIGAMVGTAQYVAPEYVETGECDHRGDIFALGVIGYEMIAGKPPFKVESTVSSMIERFRNDPPPLLSVAPHCSARLASAIEKAAKLRVSERYQDVGEFLAELRSIHAELWGGGDEGELGFGGSEHPSPLVDTVRLASAPVHLLKKKSLLSTRWVLIGVGVLCGLILTVLGLVSTQRGPAPHQDTLEEVRAKILGP